MLHKKINSVMIVRVISVLTVLSTLVFGLTGTAFATLLDGNCGAAIAVIFAFGLAFFGDAVC